MQTRGRHLFKFGALAERYADDMSNPTFSLGIYTFADLEAFLLNARTSSSASRRRRDFDRNWRFSLFGGYAAGRLPAERRASR